MQKVITNRKGEQFTVEYDEVDKKLVDGGIYIRKNGNYNAVLITKKSIADKTVNSCILARIIMNVSDPKVFVDHIDRNPLNNKRSNLRLATPRQNQHNQVLTVVSENNIYPGVTKMEKERCFKANVDKSPKIFDNNYDAIIYVYNSRKEVRGSFDPETRTLEEIALQIPYETFNREINDKMNGVLCDKCDTLIYAHFEDHYKTCTNLTCLECSAKFSSLSHLYRHQEENCSKKECVRCGSFFKNKEELGLHVKTCEYKCKYCNYHTLWNSNIARHNRDYHLENKEYFDFYLKDGGFECEYCGSQHPNQKALNAHYCRMHKEERDERKKVKCEVCEKFYTSTKTMKMHMKSQHA